MLTPNHVVIAAKAVLFLGAAAAVTLMLGPFQGLEEAFGLSDKAAHALAFGGLTAVAFLAFPKMRRNDLAIAAILLGASAEIAQLFAHRSASFTDLAADVAGIAVVYLASHIEAVRRDARERGAMRFSDISAQKQRRRRRKSGVVMPAASVAAEGEAARGSFASRAASRFPREA
ncbi:antibiotic resistance protein VanZ [Caulobacter flavus]|uniref:Antibiotic resistance protein VanZ n=1 Tax=Caulobacter flavus TaxID=1679497 RepID=A0A2N5CT44_9CAUL|nr:VanZ family protein [Caulobacter flavus]AYV49176.1 antibiotic resistance protein VanZ [Caulobacter flavus]PLR14822.1 antibiotic resistance protein VanZ [Caulobacter flavus]